VTSPAISADNAPTVSRTNFNLAWSTSQPGEYMVAQLLRYNSSLTTLEDVVTCAMTDDGSFQVPSGVWSDWDPDQVIYIAVGRVVEDGGTLPYNNAKSGVVGSYWVVGAAFTQ
jgi:hypothetical protein